jgi:hypothetical protein
VLVATGCRQLLGLSDLTPDGGQIIIDATDAQAFDDAPDAEIPLGPWGNPVRLFPTSTTADDDPSFTDDLLELYFNRNNNIYVAKRATTADAWGAPQRWCWSCRVGAARRPRRRSRATGYRSTSRRTAAAAPAAST